MNFEEVLRQVTELLEQRGRVTYRALKRQFGLDDDYLDDIRFEIIKGLRIAVDEDDEVLVYTGPAEQVAEQPASYSKTDHAAVESDIPVLAERRQLTVMFCDLVDSTQLSTQLDPEDLRDLLHEYHTACSDAIQRYEGYVAQYLGDGLLIYFGYPTAQDGSAQSAVLAALAICNAIKHINARIADRHGVHLAVRIGIHTGLVVVGTIGAGSRHEQIALGDTPNIAARIQSVAGANEVIISDVTLRLIHGYFSTEDLGCHTFKGLDTPVGIHRILGESGARTRMDAIDSGELTTFIGRDQEMTLLVERWRMSQEGRGQFILIGGEAGIGKSRLVRTLREQVKVQGANTIKFCCSPYYSNSAFHPIIEHLEKQLGFSVEDTVATKWHKLTGFCDSYAMQVDTALPLLASLLGIPLQDDYPVASLSPDKQKQETMELLISWLLFHAKHSAVVSIWEDLHWADPSTLELLGHIIERSASTRHFGLMTHRPEFHSPWPSHTNISQLFLNRFSNVLVRSMVEKLTSGKYLPETTLQEIVSKTDGIPLFIEEVTKLLLESDDTGNADVPLDINNIVNLFAVPATLQDSLMARLDRLGEAKTTAQLCAMLGREFTYELIHTVTDSHETQLQQHLQQLVKAELLFYNDTPPKQHYFFKHALIQDVAYQSLLKRDRQRYHKRIADALMTLTPEIKESRPELLAHHYAEAGHHERAVGYWQRAGERAIRQSAHQEALVQLNRGLENLNGLSASDKNINKKINLQILLGTPLTALKGYCAKEVEHTYAHALMLAKQQANSQQRFRSLYGLWRLHMLRAEYVTALAQGQELLALANKAQETSFLVASHRAMGATLFYMGNFTESRKHTEQVIGPSASLLGDSETLIRDIYDVVDPRVTCLSYAAWSSWMLGEPERALQQSNKAIELAHTIDHPFSIALSKSFAAWLHHFLADVEGTAVLAEEALAVSREYGFQFWVGWEECMLGWVAIQRGEAEEGIALIQNGLQDWQATGSRLGMAYFQTMLAEGFRQQGSIKDEQQTLEQAQRFTEQTQERWWEVEQQRLAALLLAKQGQAAQAEARLVRALELSRQQQAVPLQLRVAMSLAALWQNKGDDHAAGELLGSVLAALPESFDGTEHRQARAMLYKHEQALAR